QEYGFYDVLTGLGADPEGGLAKWGGLGLDLTLGMFADPLTPLSFGLNKAGSVARAGGKALDAAEFAKRAGGMTARAIEGGTKLPGQVLKSGVTGLDRVRAAQQGLWSPLNYAGFSLLPPSASAAVARGVDPLAHLISQNPV